MLDRAGGGLGHGSREPDGPALRDHHAMRAGRFRRPQHRAEIVRIFDAVQQQHQCRLVLLEGRLEDFLHLGIGLRSGQRDNALMAAGRDQPVQCLPRFDTNRHAGLAGKLDEFFELPVRVHDDQPAQRPRAGAQRFLYRMQAEDDLAGLTASSGWFRRAGLPV